MKLVKKEQIKNMLGQGSSKTENYNNNDFCSYIQENELTHIYCIMQRISQLFRGRQKLQTIINMKSKFSREAANLQKLQF